jgi:MoxR-like ATPase
MLGFTNGQIIVPYIVNGKVIYYSYRNLKSGNERAMGNAPGNVPCPIGFDIIKDTRIIYIAEGLFDYLTLVEKGYPALGIPGANAWKNSREWNSLFLGHKIMLAFHGDEDGFKTNRFLESICQGLSVPYEIIDWSVTRDNPEIKDINDWVMAGNSVDSLFHRDDIPTLSDIKVAIEELITLEDYPDAPDLVIALIISNMMQGDPVWILFVGPPSTGKTEVIRCVTNAVGTYFINRISPNTLVSGFTRVEGADVITRIVKPTTFCITDFGSFLSFHPQDMQKVMQQLRDVYDGKVHVEYGNGKIVDWTGKVGIIGGITPEIERHSAFIGRLGDRFLYYRMGIRESKRTEIAFNALMFAEKEDDKRKKIQQLTSKFIDHSILNIREAEGVTIPEALALQIAAIADFLSRARTPVARMHDMEKTIEYMPSYEATGRIARAFKVLAKALAYIRGRREVDETDYRILRDIARGSIPSIRYEFLKAAYTNRFDWISTSRFGEQLGKDAPSARYHLKNLLAIGMMDIEMGKKDHKWRLKEDAIKLIEASSFFVDPFHWSQPEQKDLSGEGEKDAT